MNRYVKNLKSFLAEQAPSFGFDDANSILEMLYYYYSDANPVDSAVIRCQFKQMDEVLSKLSWSDCNSIFSLVVELCSSHERQAFVEGVCVGMRLFAELEGA